jgi:hypothetical protein
MTIEPLFQLNIILWISFPSPTNGDIIPRLYTAGFNIHSLAPSITPDIRLVTNARGCGITFNSLAEPDLFFQHKKENFIVPFELKKSSFGPVALPGNHTSTKRLGQANALISLDGPFLAKYFGLSNQVAWKSRVIYTVTGNSEDSMQNTLTQLTATLSTNKIPTTNSHAFGLNEKSDGIHFELASGQTASVNDRFLKIAQSCTGLVIKMIPGQDMRPLYIIPWDPTLSSEASAEEKEYQFRVLDERIRSSFAILVVPKSRKENFELTIDELLEDTLGFSNFNIWKMWKDKDATNKIKERATAFITKEANNITKKVKGRVVKKQGNPNPVFSFTGFNSSIAKNLKKYFESTAYKTGDINLWVDPQQPSFENFD